METTFLIPDQQNGYNLVALIMVVGFGMVGTVIKSAFTKRHYDSIKLTNELISRAYLSQTTFFLSILLLVTRDKPLVLLTTINAVMAVLMLVGFVLSVRWANSNNTDDRIMRAINCGRPPDHCESFGCNHDEHQCKKELSWKDVRSVAGRHYSFAVIVLLISALMALSPVTR